jgi:hypothetical protein
MHVPQKTEINLGHREKTEISSQKSSSENAPDGRWRTGSSDCDPQNIVQLIVIDLIFLPEIELR